MNRMLRVNELLRRELGEIFERLIREEVNSLVTVTEIRTSPDLRHATVYVSVYGNDEDKGKVLSILQRERGEIQNLVVRRITLKYTPKLEFRLDEQLGKADRLLQLLDNLEIEDRDDDVEG